MSTPRKTLGDLPPEIRLRIYHYVLPSDVQVLRQLQLANKAPRHVYSKRRGYHSLSELIENNPPAEKVLIRTSILHVSRLIRNEALFALFSDATFHYNININRALGLITTDSLTYTCPLDLVLAYSPPPTQHQVDLINDVSFDIHCQTYSLPATTACTFSSYATYVLDTLAEITIVPFTHPRSPRPRRSLRLTVYDMHLPPSHPAWSFLLRDNNFIDPFTFIQNSSFLTALTQMTHFKTVQLVLRMHPWSACSELPQDHRHYQTVLVGFLVRLLEPFLGMGVEEKDEEGWEDCDPGCVISWRPGEGGDDECLKT